MEGDGVRGGGRIYFRHFNPHFSCSHCIQLLIFFFLRKTFIKIYSKLLLQLS